MLNINSLLNGTVLILSFCVLGQQSTASSVFTQNLKERGIVLGVFLTCRNFIN